MNNIVEVPGTLELMEQAYLKFVANPDGLIVSKVNAIQKAHAANRGYGSGRTINSSRSALQSSLGSGKSSQTKPFSKVVLHMGISSNPNGKHINLEDLSQMKLINILRSPNVVHKDLYYLAGLFFAYAQSVKSNSSLNPENMKILEHYSQNALWLQQTLPSFCSVSDMQLEHAKSSALVTTASLGPLTKRLTLLFDLDETLAHCHNKDLLTAKSLEVSIRPYAFHVLQELKSQFEIGLYTSAHEDYANSIVQLLDPLNQLFDFRLYKKSCIMLPDGILYKDLRVLQNRKTDKIFLVDNNFFCFGAQMAQGIPILPFTGDQQDSQLMLLLSYLQGLVKSQDPASYNAQYFGHDLLLQNLGSLDQLPPLMLDRIVLISGKLDQPIPA